MPFFQPHDCSIDLATPYWLLAALALLIVAALALVIQAILLWRRVGRVDATWWMRWWARTPLALPLLWAAICALLAAQAFGFYRLVTTPSQCGPGSLCSYKGICIPVAQVGDMTQFALVVAALLLGAGWLALARLSRRIQRA
jgi:hypothetical protein